MYCKQKTRSFTHINYAIIGKIFDFLEITAALLLQIIYSNLAF